ncbi:hypothetical protein [Halomonas sp. GFAJ-1]|uniref:hypothetical protein n=1 Tax=Halomonas sp. GFAJ-1 TaxID=1118153 RepID=UPI00023A3383|nr:hypothetical protein [Halomonas sp. GFAJ-1]AVI63511.1 hypothetical protein BB497_12780 [Halomonas sp. GFAJ-1]EHK61498.1 hypothetical protein MOY_05596 [Halomonas sp. GFAJ-1]
MSASRQERYDNAEAFVKYVKQQLENDYSELSLWHEPEFTNRFNQLKSIPSPDPRELAFVELMKDILRAAWAMPSRNPLEVMQENGGAYKILLHRAADLLEKGEPIEGAVRTFLIMHLRGEISPPKKRTGLRTHKDNTREITCMSLVLAAKRCELPISRAKESDSRLNAVGLVSDVSGLSFDRVEKLTKQPWIRPLLKK